MRSPSPWKVGQLNSLRESFDHMVEVKEKPIFVNLIVKTARKAPVAVAVVGNR